MVGPIRASTSGRYFVDRAGEPFFWLGDTQWELVRCFPTEDAAAILENRKRKGFNVLHVMLTGVGDGTKPNLHGQRPWIGDDPARPNEAYFRQVDEVVRAARESGIILCLGVYHQTHGSRMTPAKAETWAQWVGERYRDAPSLIWSMYPKAEKEYVPLCRRIAAGLEQGDGGGHMITLHPDPSPTSSSFIHEEPWLGCNMIQTCMSMDLIYPMVTRDYARSPSKPVVMAEGAYEGLNFCRTQAPLDIRKQAYWSFLAGGYHTYGHSDNWSATQAWRQWLDAPGSFHAGVSRKVITSLPDWWDLVPDQTIISRGHGSGIELNVAARSPTGAWALVYVNRAYTLTVRMDFLASGRTPQVWWIDPTTGERTPVEPPRDSDPRDFTILAGWEDGLLLLTEP